MGLRLRSVIMPLLFALAHPAVSAEPAPSVRLYEIGSAPLASAPRLLPPRAVNPPAAPARTTGPIDTLVALASRFN